MCAKWKHEDSFGLSNGDGRNVRSIAIRKCTESFFGVSATGRLLINVSPLLAPALIPISEYTRTHFSVLLNLFLFPLFLLFSSFQATSIHCLTASTADWILLSSGSANYHLSVILLSDILPGIAEAFRHIMLIADHYLNYVKTHCSLVIHVWALKRISLDRILFLLLFY